MEARSHDNISDIPILLSSYLSIYSVREGVWEITMLFCDSVSTVASWTNVKPLLNRPGPLRLWFEACRWKLLTLVCHCLTHRECAPAPLQATFKISSNTVNPLRLSQSVPRNPALVTYLGDTETNMTSCLSSAGL